MLTGSLSPAPAPQIGFFAGPTRKVAQVLPAQHARPSFTGLAWKMRFHAGRGVFLPGGVSLSTKARRGKAMLYYALMFLIVGLVAGALGLFGVAEVASRIAWVLFLIGVVILVVHLVSGRSSRVL